MANKLENSLCFNDLKHDTTLKVTLHTQSLWMPRDVSISRNVGYCEVVLENDSQNLQSK